MISSGQSVFRVLCSVFQPFFDGLLGQRGATLVELLAGTLCGSVLLALAASWARDAMFATRAQQVQSEAQEAVLVTTEMVVRDLRMAGFSGSGAPLMRLSVATPEAVEIDTDLNGDGDQTDANETIAYGYNAANGQLTRATSGGSPQPLLRNVRAGGLHLTYFDAAGALLPAPPSGLDAESRRRIRRIDVAIRVDLPHPDPRVRDPITAMASSTAALRNVESGAQ